MEKSEVKKEKKNMMKSYYSRYMQVPTKMEKPNMMIIETINSK